MNEIALKIIKMLGDELQIEKDRNKELKKQLEEEHKACVGAKKEVNYWWDRYLKTKHGKDAKGEIPYPEVMLYK